MLSSDLEYDFTENSHIGSIGSSSSSIVGMRFSLQQRTDDGIQDGKNAIKMEGETHPSIRSDPILISPSYPVSKGHNLLLCIPHQNRIDSRFASNDNRIS